MGLSFNKRLKLMMAKFTITVVVYSVYQNVAYPRIYKGIYFKDRISVGDGKVDAHHFYFKKALGKYQEVNEVSMNNIIDLGNKRMVQLVQLAEDVFLPLVPYEKRLYYQLKVPDVDDHGIQKYERKVQKVPIFVDGVQAKDKDGNLVFEEQELEPVPLFKTQEYVFNTMAEVQTAKGEIIPIPAMLPQENYANRVHSQAEHLRMSSRYASKDVWSKYGNLIMLIVAFAGIALVMKFNYDGFLAASAQLSASNQAVASAITELVKANVTIAR